MIERPSVLVGLEAKRSELLKHRAWLVAEQNKVTCDLDHLDAAIRLVGTPGPSRTLTPLHRVRNGELWRFLRAFLQNAPKPANRRELTDAWIAHRGLQADDATVAILRKRMGARLTQLQALGQIESVELAGELKGWRLARSSHGVRDAASGSELTT